MGARDDVYWAGFFGIEPVQWGSAGVSFRPQVGLRGYRGLWCFRRVARVIVSAPVAWVDALERRWAGWDAERLLDAAAVSASLGEACERCIGPAFQGCIDSESFRERASSKVRPRQGSDAPALARFRARCGEAAWSDSGLHDAGALCHVYAEGPDITAMAGLREKSDAVGDLCVLTDPRVRGEGRGASVVSAVVRDGLAAGRHLLYQTLQANRAAVRLATSLGFAQYATHLAVRLSSDAPSSGHDSST